MHASSQTLSLHETEGANQLSTWSSRFPAGNLNTSIQAAGNKSPLTEVGCMATLEADCWYVKWFRRCKAPPQK
eukprot:s6012_g1.t1